MLVATASATQDIVVDAFRVESLETSEQGAGMAGYVAAYRIGMLVSGAGVLVLVALLERLGVAREAVWMWGYIAAAFGMAIGIVATLLATEPDAPPQLVDHSHSPLKRLAETATGAFGELVPFGPSFEAVVVVLAHWRANPSTIVWSCFRSSRAPYHAYTSVRGSSRLWS